MKRTTLTLTGASALNVLATAIRPDEGTKAAERLAHVAAHPGLEGLASVLYFASAAAFVVAGLFAFADRPTGRGSRATGIGIALTSLTSIWLAASFSAFGLFLVQLVQDHVPASLAHALVDGEAAPWQHAFDLALLCQLAGPVVLGVGLRRAGRSGWLPPAAYLVGILGYGATEFLFRPGQVAGLLVVTGALFWMGRAIDQSAHAPADAPADAPAMEQQRS